MTKPLRKLFLLLAASGLVVLLVELVVGRVLPFGVPLFQVDEELLHAPRPGVARARLLDRQGGRLSIVRFGAEGYRGADLQAGSLPRLVVIGDSLVLAENVEHEETFVQRLSYHLEQEGTPVETVNAGVTGYGPDQALLRLERELAMLRPDGVLFVLCAHNDHGDLLRNKLFDLSPEGELVRRAPALAPELRRQFRVAMENAGEPALLRLLRVLRRSTPPEPAGSSRVTQLYLQLGQQELLQHRRDDLVHDVFGDPYDLTVAAALPGADRARALMVGVLARLARTCREADVPLFALVVPSAVDVVPGFEPGIDTALVAGHDPGALTRACVEALDLSGIATLDGATLFEGEIARSSFPARGDFHWNAAGQDRAARACAGFLEALGWPP